LSSVNSSDHPGARPSRLLLDLGQDRLADEDIEALEVCLRADGLMSPPPWVRRRAERIASHGRPTRWLDVPRRFVAKLAFDSQAQPQYVGLRAAHTRIRRLLFQAEGLEVDLEVTPTNTPERVRLAGQVTAAGSDPSAGFLRLSTAAGDWTTPFDESGEFWLDNLTTGAYRLEVSVGDRVVEIPVLPI